MCGLKFLIVGTALIKLYMAYKDVKDEHVQNISGEDMVKQYVV